MKGDKIMKKEKEFHCWDSPNDFIEQPTEEIMKAGYVFKWNNK
jgi:hypothetical protein